MFHYQNWKNECEKDDSKPEGPQIDKRTMRSSALADKNAYHETEVE